MNNLFLIGYRGTGKTVLGMAVAKKLAKEFIDTDKRLVELAGKSIPKIFENDGEEIFREWETKALEAACGKADAVISCGGGIITQERNFPLLEKGVVCKMKGRIPQVKILANGKLTKKLIIEGCLFSKQAEEKIKKAGGKIKF